MAFRGYPDDIVSQTSGVLAACKQINPALTIAGLTQAQFADDLAHAQAIQAQIQSLELQLIELRNQREKDLIRLWDTVKRARSTVKGTYGDDSSEYELIGGTRRSSYKRTKRRQK